VSASKLSVAEHIANIKPPPMTKSLIFGYSTFLYRDFSKTKFMLMPQHLFLFNVPAHFYKLHKIYRIALKIFMMQVQPIIKQQLIT
jgi:hypothetical protein